MDTTGRGWALLCAATVVFVLVASGCTRASSNAGRPQADAPPGSSADSEQGGSGAPDTAYLSGDDPVLVAQQQIAQDSGVSIDNLTGVMSATAVDGLEVWALVNVKPIGTPRTESESVYLLSVDEGPWRVMTYGTGVEMGDLEEYGASDGVERALFYPTSANEVLYEYLEDVDKGRWAQLHTVRQRFLNLGDNGFWALVDLAEYSSEARVILLAVLMWDMEEGDWTVVAHGQDAYSVSEEPPEQLLSGPWTNDIRY